MSEPENRRDFIKKGSVIAAGALAAAPAAAAAQEPAHEKAARGGSEARAPQVPPHRGAVEVPIHPENIGAGKFDLPDEFKVYDRYYPTFGGPPESPTYLGKLVPGLRASGLPPVPFVQPDVPRMPWKMVDGVKEFHLTLGHVRRELMPGQWFDFYGANGSMPGPYVEVTQGDMVRFVVHNHLPEPTSVHWHGAELPSNMDGVPGTTQDFIEPGSSYVYQFRMHQIGTFFYRAHVPYQEAIGILGFLIVHPRIAWDPPVDRDFGYFIMNTSTAPNTAVATPFPEHPGPAFTSTGYNWNIVNGRSAPYITPFVCKLGERVRIRLFNFSVVDIHAMHMHGTNFWITGYEGARQPVTHWFCRSTEKIHVAQAADLEFIANDPGDWVFHCHMAQHMALHPYPQMGPRIRSDDSLVRSRANLATRPDGKYPDTDPGLQVPGDPRLRFARLEFTPAELEKLNARREMRGMRHNWYEPMKSLFTFVRILPEDLYDLVMNSDEPVAPGSVFDEITRRRHQQVQIREELRRRGLTMVDWHDWMTANEALRRKGMA